MIGDLTAGLVTGLAVALPFGAVASYLVGLAARERLTTAAAAALGVATVDGAYAVVAALGGAGLQSVLRLIAPPLRIVAALVLATVAARTLQQAWQRYHRTSGLAGPDEPARTPRLITPARAYLRLLAMTAVNPATVLTFAAVVVGRGASGGRPDWSAVVLFAGGAFAASAGWQLVLAGGGSLLGRAGQGRRGQFVISSCSSVLMLALAVAVLAG